MNRKEREHWLTNHGFHNVDAVVGAAEREGVLIVRAAALTLNESSGGLNIYGHEGSTPELYGQPVTEQNYKSIYLPRVATEGRNGVGLTQLTSAGYQEEADRIGGCWNAYFNCIVGFKLLHELIEQHGVWGGYEHFNGAGPAAEAYATKALAECQRLEREGLR
jgi:hypothetical protein